MSTNREDDLESVASRLDDLESRLDEVEQTATDWNSGLGAGYGLGATSRISARSAANGLGQWLPNSGGGAMGFHGPYALCNNVDW